MQDPPKAKKMPKKEIKKESTHLVVLYMQHASCIPGQEQPSSSKWDPGLRLWSTASLY